MKRPSTLVDRISNINPYQRGAISTTYNTPFARHPLASYSLRNTWARDLNMEIHGGFRAHEKSENHVNAMLAWNKQTKKDFDRHFNIK